MQKFVTTKGDLLNSDGTLIEVGYATHPVRTYNPENVSIFPFTILNKIRIKEWDYYGITTDEFFVSATISNLGYAGLAFVYFIDFISKEYVEDTLIVPFGKGFVLGKSSAENSFFKKDDVSFKFIAKGAEREIFVKWPNFRNGKGFSAHWILHQKPRDSIVMMTPIGEKGFYYNQKINCMPAEGAFVLGSKEYAFARKKALATLDWGRGVWEYRSFWNWASASGFLPNGKTFGLNLGKGFGDLSQATENCFFIDGVIHKLDYVEFHYDSANFMKPWHFNSLDGRLALEFKPFFERVAKSNLLIVASEVHQLFGKYSGTVIAESGKKLKIENIIGWAEEHKARW
ncbi:MAG: DUF2804 domain-containing protein [Spirochaetes bacterium]|nr:DUF2804 domain-containing protein [Spirochaetota bacterium]